MIWSYRNFKNASVMSMNNFHAFQADSCFITNIAQFFCFTYVSKLGRSTPPCPVRCPVVTVGRASQESWVRVWGPIPKTLNLIYEQTLWHLPPYLSPGQKFDTIFMTIAPGTVTGTKRLKTHTFWGCMHLYSPYKGVTPPGSFHPWASKLHFEFFSTEGYPETLLQAHNLRTL